MIKVSKCLLLIPFILLPTMVLSQSKTQFRGFTDVDLGVDLDGKPSAFYMGQYDNYVTSQISDEISFLGEVVFEYDEGWILDVERVILKYEWSNALNVQAGKFHTPLGYWNNTYHHGGLIEPTITRPLSVKFEDEGGVLPIHTSGLWIQGDYIGSLNFGYDVVVGNGLGATPLSDNNSFKSITSQLRIEPISGCKFGVSYYFDKASSGSSSLIPDSTLSARMTQNIANAYATFKSNKLEVIAEGFFIQNSLQGGSVTESLGYFVYAGWTIREKLTPYLRFDVVEFGNNDPYFLKDNKTLVALGMRYEVSMMSVLKLAYKNMNSELNGISNRLEMSWAIGF